MVLRYFTTRANRTWSEKDRKAGISCLSEFNASELEQDYFPRLLFFAKWDANGIRDCSSPYIYIK